MLSAEEVTNMENNNSHSFLAELEEGQSWTDQYNAEEDFSIIKNQRLAAELKQQQLLALQSQQYQQQQHQFLPPQQQQQSQPQQQSQQVDEGDFLGDLIEEVKLYRCLWDSSCRAFKELPKKQQAWSLVAERFNIDGMCFLSYRYMLLPVWCVCLTVPRTF